MKTKTNRRVKRSKKTRRTRRNLRKVRGGGLIAKGREWLERRSERNQAMDEIDNDYWKCKVLCEGDRDIKLRKVKEQFDTKLKKEKDAQPQVASLTKIHPIRDEIELEREREKDKYDKSGAAIQVAEYKENNSNAYSRMESMDFAKFEKHDLHRKEKPTDNGWYVDLSDPKNPFLRNTNDETISLKTFGIQNEYEAHLTRLPNPSFKYKSPIPSSPDYILVQEGTDKLKWQNWDTKKLIPFSPVWPLLATDDKGYNEVVLQPTVEPAQRATIGTSDA